MAAKTKEEKAAEAAQAEEARRAELTQEERDAEDAAAKAEADAKAAKSSKKTSVTVAYEGTTREYSKAVHGDEFEVLAEEFAAKRNGKIV